jgi:NAD(P)-dependent dehydrogenase (short-subunit alcohol dehydrogenase family)
LGSHFAQTLASMGAAVVLAARRSERLEALADAIRNGGGIALPVALDVGDAASISAALEQVHAALGPVDILVNNSGVAGRAGKLLDVTAEEMAAVLDVNLLGAFRMAQAVVRGLIAAGKPGSIINIASVLATRTSPGVAGYAASKAALLHLTRFMALEWARHEVRANAIAPGYIITDMNRDYLSGEAGAAMSRRIPQRRFGEPADLDGALLLLASDASRYMTGAVLTVDGGHTCAGL